MGMGNHVDRRKQRPRNLLLVCSIICSALPACSELPTAGVSLSEMVIAVTPNATPAEATAVTELAGYLEKVTGVSYEPVREDKVRKGQPVIYVGQTSFATKHGIDFTRLGEEQWIIRTAGRSIILAGGRPRGTLYAVYEFLERYADCHWLAEDTEVVPHQPRLTLGKINVKSRPAFNQREIYTLVRDLTRTPEKLRRESLFHARNKSNGETTYLGKELGFCLRSGAPGGSHTFYSYLNPKEYFAEHPEYFSVGINGKRLQSNGQLCLTNPDVLRIFTKKLEGFIATDRKAARKAGVAAPHTYTIGMNDYHRLCYCVPCQTITRREGSESGPLIEFLNQIADAIKKDYPEIMLRTLAYTVTQKPPGKLKPRQNISIQLCDLRGDCFRPISHPHNAQFLQYLRQWSKIADHLSVWDYWITYGDEFASPYSNVYCMQQDLQLLKSVGVEGVFVENENAESQSFFALKRWLGLKLMQDPEQSSNELIQIFMKGYYGRAERRMTDYHQYLVSRIVADEGKLSSLSPYLRNYLDIEFFIKANRLLDQAEKACGNDATKLLHVRRERIPVDAALLNLWEQLKQKLKKAQPLPFKRQDILKRYKDNRLAQMKALRSGWTMPAGTKALSEELARLQTIRPPLPDQFRQLPTSRVVDFHWPSFRESRYGRLVADPDAAGGKALRYQGDGPKDHVAPMVVGVYDGARKVFGPRITMKASDLHQDGEYHWYKIGNFPITNGVLVWAHSSWWLTVALNRACRPAALNRNCDVWVSLKMSGPAYVKGSKERNSVWLDRIILIRAVNSK